MDYHYEQGADGGRTKPPSGSLGGALGAGGRGTGNVFAADDFEAHGLDDREGIRQTML